jgi:acetyl-CoA/propionyl-CoA carboxylase biotin carboxyl carrier protein
VFETVLIANRGEIAVRIARTLRSLGIRSVAVFSDADRTARHVAEADIAVHIGPAAAVQSYLSVERIIDAAVRSGAQALHPGYGFLSENVALAAACAEAGIVFVGPPVTAIEAMGDKIRAKRTVSANGVRVVPGVDGDGATVDELIAAAQTIGFPALIKPSAGGGGKGMRVVTSADEWPAAIASAQREARASFGDDTLLVERYIERPRHIEVQILADSHGNVVHLGERECSLQRRHQKVIEEAPSPLLSDEQRAALGAQAVAAARACGYVNAGTVEFVVSGEHPDDAFFLEMNTRLQVEHPVTEMVWGIDLVEQQLRVAAGLALPFTQAELTPRGHAFEARVYAEDPAAGFLPTGGTVERLHEPVDRPHVRVDSSLHVGTVVGSDYDPMLAKVIAWGAGRDLARRRLDSALADTTVLGVVTNVAFLRHLLADDDVAAGRMDTGLIDRRSASLTDVDPPATVAVAAALALLAASAGPGAWGDRSGWRPSGATTVVMPLVDGRGRACEVRLQRAAAHSWTATVGEWTAAVAAVVEHDCMCLTVDGLVEEYSLAATRTGVWLGRQGASWRYTAAAAHGPRRNATAAAELTVVSPMPGTVVSIDVAVGDEVDAGRAVAVVEAMKMEHTLRAGQRAVVRAVSAAAGERVGLHQPLVVLEALDDPAD